MLKTAIVTVASLGVIGTGAQTVETQNVDVSIGILTLQHNADGFKAVIDDTMSFGVKITSQTGRTFGVIF